MPGPEDAVVLTPEAPALAATFAAPLALVLGKLGAPFALALPFFKTFPGSLARADVPPRKAEKLNSETELASEAQLDVRLRRLASRSLPLLSRESL